MRQTQPTLLIVDNNKESKRWFQKNLRGEFKILSASSLKQADLLFSKDGIDLVIIDQQMPGLEDLSFCRHLHRQPRNGHVAIILITEREDFEYFHNALASGVSDFINKPLSSFEVRKSIYLTLQFQYKLLSMGSRLSDFKRLAHHDALTQLYNRRQLFDKGAKELAKAKRSRSSLSLLMLDIDHFKRINNKWGHLVGDDILTQFARLLLANLRSYDLIIRYGGEEFIVVLPNTTPAKAKLVAEKLRKYIEKYPFFNGKNFFHLTCSIGLAHLSSATKTMEDLIDHVDSALLTAKKRGRNRIATYKSPKK